MGPLVGLNQGAIILDCVARHVTALPVRCIIMRPTFATFSHSESLVIQGTMHVYKVNLVACFADNTRINQCIIFKQTHVKLAWTLPSVSSVHQVCSKGGNPVSSVTMLALY